MGDYVALNVDNMDEPESSQSLKEEGSSSQVAEKMENSVIYIQDVDEHDETDDEKKPLVEIVECRICQEEDSLQSMETPCACSGSLKFAHRKCVQRWCNEKGDTTCEICQQPYQPGYTAPPPPPPSEDAIIDLSGWRIHGPAMEMPDPRLVAMAAAERHMLEAEYDEYSDPNASAAAFCRSAALILMTLLLLRHALMVGDGDTDDDDDGASTFFTIFLLRAAGFLLPCYIMAWAISIMQRRREAQEAAAALAATEVAFMIHAGQRRGVHFTVAPRPAVTPTPAAGTTVTPTTGPVPAPPPEQPAQ